MDFFSFLLLLLFFLINLYIILLDAADPGGDAARTSSFGRTVEALLC